MMRSWIPEFLEFTWKRCLLKKSGFKLAGNNKEALMDPKLRGQKVLEGTHDFCEMKTPGPEFLDYPQIFCMMR